MDRNDSEVDEGEEHVSSYYEEDGEGEHVMDERRTGSPIDREEPKPFLEHGAGGEHHHDGTANEDRVELRGPD